MAIGAYYSDMEAAGAPFDPSAPPVMSWSDPVAHAPEPASVPQEASQVEPPQYHGESVQNAMPTQHALQDSLPPALHRTFRQLPTSNSGKAGLGDMGDSVDHSLLGAAFLIVGVGHLIGGMKGGLLGSLAGGFYGGAAVNAVRAARSYKSQPKEATISGTFAILGAGIGTYLLWKLGENKAKKEKGTD